MRAQSVTRGRSVLPSDQIECKKDVKYPVRERSAQVPLFGQTVGDPVPYVLATRVIQERLEVKNCVVPQDFFDIWIAEHIIQVLRLHHAL